LLNSNKPVVIYRVGSIGDHCISVPALKLIRSYFKLRKLILVSNSPNPNSIKECSSINILSKTGLIDEFIFYNSKFSFIKIFFKLFLFQCDKLIYLMPVRSKFQLIRDFLFFKIIFVKKIFGLKFSKQYQTHFFYENLNIWESEASRLCRLVHNFGTINLNCNSSWSLNLTNSEYEFANRVLSNLSRPFFAISFGTKFKVKDWGHANWISLIKLLSLHKDLFSIVLIGSSDEYERGSNLLSYWEGESLNLCGKVSPRESAAIMSFAKFYIGHDTGPMHLASSTSIPIIALFSSRSLPGVWFPGGSSNSTVLYKRVDCMGCLLTDCQENAMKCIYSITPDEVYRSSMKFIDHP
jgi:heptosyltransferase-3